MKTLKYLIFIRWIFYYVILTTILSKTFAQDSIKVYQDTLQVLAIPYVKTCENEQNSTKWGFGLFLGLEGPLFPNKIGASIENGPAYSFGFEVDYSNLFSNLNVGWAESKVKSDFSFLESWPNKLPLDLVQFYFSLGYRIKLSKIIHLKPMFYVTFLGYSTDDKIIDFTGINRSANVGYYGISLGAFVDDGIPISDHLGYECTIGLGNSIGKIDDTIFPKYAWNVSIGLLFYTGER